ncbi:MAG TPA: dihydrofolate reductase [Planctomycetota bacterium]
MRLAVVVAVDDAGGIGKDGGLPWRLRGDLAHFRALTTEAPPGRRNAVLLGRRTWNSLPERFRPLPGRLNLVLTRRGLVLPEGVVRAASFAAARALLAEEDDLEQVFAIGGASVYAAALADPACARIHLTRVHGDFDCDVHFPGVPEDFRVVAQAGPFEEDGQAYEFLDYERTPVQARPQTP